MIDISANVTGIILAAGKSSRFGQTKQLLPLGDKTILACVIETAIESIIKKIVLVLGHDASEIYETLNYPEISVVHNPMFNKGQSYSIKYGLREADKSTDAVLIILGDQPLIMTSTINKLIRTYAEKRSLIVLPTFEEKQGNPVLFDRRLFKNLENLSGDAGGRVLFNEYPDQITRIEVRDPGIHFDVDTQADYLKLQELMK